MEMYICLLSTGLSVMAVLIAIGCYFKVNSATKAEQLQAKLLADLNRMMDDLKATAPNEIDPKFFIPTEKEQ